MTTRWLWMGVLFISAKIFSTEDPGQLVQQFKSEFADYQKNFSNNDLNARGSAYDGAIKLVSEKLLPLAGNPRVSYTLFTGLNYDGLTIDSAGKDVAAFIKNLLEKLYAKRVALEADKISQSGPQTCQVTAKDVAAAEEKGRKSRDQEVGGLKAQIDALPGQLQAKLKEGQESRNQEVSGLQAAIVQMQKTIEDKLREWQSKEAALKKEGYDQGVAARAKEYEALEKSMNEVVEGLLQRSGESQSLVESLKKQLEEELPKKTKESYDSGRKSRDADVESAKSLCEQAKNAEILALKQAHDKELEARFAAGANSRDADVEKARTEGKVSRDAEVDALKKEIERLGKVASGAESSAMLIEELQAHLAGVPQQLTTQFEAGREAGYAEHKEDKKIESDRAYDNGVASQKPVIDDLNAKLKTAFADGAKLRDEEVRNLCSFVEVAVMQGEKLQTGLASLKQTLGSARKRPDGEKAGTAKDALIKVLGDAIDDIDLLSMPAQLIAGLEKCPASK